MTDQQGPLKQAFRLLSSMRLTVVLLAMYMFLVFAGTWAQIDMGIWQTLKSYFRSLYVFIPFQIFLPRAWDVPGGIPFPGGFLIGGLLFMNLLAAHAVRFQFTWKRVGLLLIHIGLVLLIVGELVTSLYANEANMSIDEGQTVSFAEDTREVELAIIDPTDPEVDRVVVIPESKLKKEQLISHPELPFDVRVEAYYENSDLYNITEAPPNARQLANQGLAITRGVVAVERPVVSGVKTNVIDVPVAYVTAYDDGENLGTWLTTLYFSLVPQGEEQVVMVDGKPYVMSMRYKRMYKPYSMTLVDFRHDRYLGTETPKNFSSHIRLVDTTRNEDREVLIYMNNPLRYRGETFYQASFKRGDTGTILQVVRNPGWLLPYIAVTIGAVGMLIHFGISLTSFLRRNKAS